MDGLEYEEGSLLSGVDESNENVINSSNQHN